MSSQKVARVAGVALVVLGVLGFIPNPLVGDGSIFHTDSVHNLLHLITGAILIWAGSRNINESIKWLKIFGWAYLALLVLGLVAVGFSGEGSLFGVVAINGADNILHLLIAGAFFYTGYKLFTRSLNPADY